MSEAIIVSEELIQRARARDMYAIEDIYEKFRKLIVYLVRKYDNGLHEEEDLISTGYVALLKAIKTFDTTKGVLFATYLAKCCMNEIFLYYRKNDRHRATINVSLDEPINIDADGNELTLENIIPDISSQEELELNELLSIYNKTLSKVRLERDRIIIRDKLENELTQKEIGDNFGLSQSYVCRIVTRFTKKLEKELKEERKFMSIRLTKEDKKNIIKLTREGYDCSQICATLSLSPSAVRNHYYTELKVMKKAGITVPTIPKAPKHVPDNGEINIGSIVEQGYITLNKAVPKEHVDLDVKDNATQMFLMINPEQESEIRTESDAENDSAPSFNINYDTDKMSKGQLITMPYMQREPSHNMGDFFLQGDVDTAGDLVAVIDNLLKFSQGKEARFTFSLTWEG